MFTYASVETVTWAGYRRIYQLICRKSARKCSPLEVKKIPEPQFLSDTKWCFAFKGKHGLIPKVSRLHVVSKFGCLAATSSVPPNFKNFIRHYQTKSQDFNKEEDDNSESENKATNVLDDLEFQSILKDFAHDFGVNEDSNKFLDEIKQNLEGSFENEINKSPNRTGNSHQLEFKSNQEYGTDSNEPNFEETQNDSVHEEYFHIDQELKELVEYDAKRGKEGVYDIDELVLVLKQENVADISVIQVPQTFHYADYLVLATAKSARHCQAVIEFLIKLYKKKKSKADPFVKCAGEKTSPWKALDMGNIVLHLFLQETRNFYDIESLWLFDRKYDSAGAVRSDPQLDVMQQHLDFLNTLNSQ